MDWGNLCWSLENLVELCFPQKTEDLTLIYEMGIWSDRNQKIFHARAFSSNQLVAQVLVILDSILVESENSRSWVILEEQIDITQPWDFVEGSSQVNRHCGGDAILFLNENYYFKLKSDLGLGSKSYVELLSMKLLFRFALEKGCRQLHIFGDSRVVVNWFNETVIFHMQHSGLLSSKSYRWKEGLII